MEIRKEELTLEELEAQQVELLPDRDEMLLSSCCCCCCGGVILV